MRQTLTLFLLLLATASAQTGTEGVTIDTAAQPSAGIEREQRMAWWRQAKFGMFIHWGVYAVPAGAYKGKTDYGEWIMNKARIPVAEYREFARSFNPTKYDPDAWTALAHQAGMRYIVITSKHHDGFALFPSKASSWNVVEATPYGQDLLGPLVAAAKARGLKIGFYYSQAQDWVNPGGAKSGYREAEGWDPAHKGSFDNYLSNVALPQVKELLENYPIDILWWDTPVMMNGDRIAPFARLLSAYPKLITNNRLGPSAPGDTATPEQFVPITGIKGDWETCMTINSRWGYNAADQNWKTARELIRKLADICSKGGNFLLNVGPTAEGEIPAGSIERLKEVGRWLEVNGGSIYGTTAGPFPALSWGRATARGNRLYLHVFDWPADGKLRVPLVHASGRAWMLRDSTKTHLGLINEPRRLVIKVPIAAPDADNSVVVLDLDQPALVAPPPIVGAKASASAWAPGAEPSHALDGTGTKRWRAPLEHTRAWLQLELRETMAISGVGFEEPDVWPRLQQEFQVEYKTPTGWVVVNAGVTNGHGKVTFFKPITTDTLRLSLKCSTGGPGIAEMQLYSPE